jgi:hypothetical protein
MNDQKKTRALAMVFVSLFTPRLDRLRRLQSKNSIITYPFGLLMLAAICFSDLLIGAVSISPCLADTSDGTPITIEDALHYLQAEKKASQAEIERLKKQSAECKKAIDRIQRKREWSKDKKQDSIKVLRESIEIFDKQIKEALIIVSAS